MGHEETHALPRHMPDWIAVVQARLLRGGRNEERCCSCEVDGRDARKVLFLIGFSSVSSVVTMSAFECGRESRCERHQRSGTFSRDRRAT
jgi:hypothetical protein